MKRTTEKTKHIAVRTVRFTVIASIVLGLASLLVGLHVYRNTILDESVRVNRTNAAKAAMVAQKSEDSAGLARDVMGVYDSLTPKQRNRTGTEEYRVYFRGLDSVSGADGTSTILSYKLRNYAQEVSAVYLCALYREGNAMVCLADSAEENPISRGMVSIPAEWTEKNAKDRNNDWTGGSTLYFFRDAGEKGRICMAVFPVADETKA